MVLIGYILTSAAIMAAALGIGKLQERFDIPDGVFITIFWACTLAGAVAANT